MATAMSAIEAATTKEAIDAAVAQFKANVGKVEKLPTDKPADSSTSQNSSTPDESVVDEGGCFSVVGGSVALSGLGLAAAAIVADSEKNGKLTVTLFEHIGVRKKNVITREAEKLWNDIKKIEFEG